MRHFVKVEADSIIRIRNAAITIVLFAFLLIAISSLAPLDPTFSERLFCVGGFAIAIGLFLPCAGAFFRCPACKRRLIAASPLKQIQYLFGSGCPSCGAIFVRGSDAA